MKQSRYISIALKVLTVAVLTCAFLLTFTLSDYYIFNRFARFDPLFVISQWVKKSALLLIPLAVFYKKRSCADAVKYFLPVFVVFSSLLFGDFFDVTKPADTPAQEIYNAINLFFPKQLNVALFFAQNVLMLCICALLFVRDGLGARTKGLLALAAAILLCMPLNVFENFFDINAIPADSFLRFYNFTVWHLLAIAVLAGFTIGCYLFLRNKTRKQQDFYLAALAIALLIQYHSKDSMVLGDGYNVYHTVFACIPLFICNIGVYVASISVLIKKRTTYAISFFIHAVGALSVFVYFGRDEMSNYGIFCSYSILYFCFTHCVLFALSVLPTALGRYKFAFRDSIIPLAYYFTVIILAAVCSALITSLSSTWTTAAGDRLSPDQLLYPNYAFTQINPLPFSLPVKLPLKIWNYEVDVLYLIALYLVYVALFFAFNAMYFAFLAIRRKWINRRIFGGQATGGALAEAAVADDEDNDSL